jgi:hypothetical protein
MREDFAAIVLNADIPAKPGYLVDAIARAEVWLRDNAPAGSDERAALDRLCSVRDQRAIDLAEAEPADDPNDTSDRDGD